MKQQRPSTAKNKVKIVLKIYIQKLWLLVNWCNCRAQLACFLSFMDHSPMIPTVQHLKVSASFYCFLFLFQVFTWQDRSEPCYSILVRSRDLSQLLLTFWFSQWLGSGSTFSKVTSSRMEKPKFQLSQQNQQGYILLRVGRGCWAKHRQFLDVPDNTSTSNFLLF